MKGGNKTVINMGNFGGGDVYTIAVLHRECGSFGKTNRLVVAWYDGFHVFALISPQHIIWLLCFLHSYLGAVDCLTVASFTFAYLAKAKALVYN